MITFVTADVVIDKPIAVVFFGISWRTDVQSVVADMHDSTGWVSVCYLAFIITFHLMGYKFAREPIIKTVAKHFFTLTYFLVGIDVFLQCSLKIGVVCS